MERTVAKCLLEIKAIFFGFSTEYISSKGERLPVYCNNRVILSYPRVRKVITKWLTNVIKETYPDAEMIIGTSIAGTSFAVLISDALGLPSGYVLEANASSASEERIKEAFKPGIKIVVIDDTICTGVTLVSVVETLRRFGCNVLGGVSLFSYELEKTDKMLEDKGIKYTALTNFDTVTLIGQQTGKISYNEYLQALKFKEEPFTDNWYKK
ncbi:MAG: phosphoribosyltransferase family protein [Bacilli bacterium]|nr:phosphoribosyltransferase family protein [Bacilli bacterium]